MAYFKGKGWVTLSAGGGLSGFNFRDFHISCGLTSLGMSHIDDIIENIFYLIQCIEKDGIDEWRYKEKQAIMESIFRFQEPISAIDTVSHLAINLFKYNLNDCIYGDYMMDSFDEKEIRFLLSFLKPSNLRIQLIAQGLDTDRLAMVLYSLQYKTD